MINRNEFCLYSNGIDGQPQLESESEQLNIRRIVRCAQLSILFKCYEVYCVNRNASPKKFFSLSSPSSLACGSVCCYCCCCCVLFRHRFSCGFFVITVLLVGCQSQTTAASGSILCIQIADFFQSRVT